VDVIKNNQSHILLLKKERTFESMDGFFLLSLELLRSKSTTVALVEGIRFAIVNDSLYNIHCGVLTGLNAAILHIDNKRAH
jgi:hypothetical protein